MITLISTLASIVFYFLAGWLAAVRNLPRAWAESRKQWKLEDLARDSVKARTASMVMFWPFYLPGRAIGVFFGHVIDAGDPEVIARKSKDQQVRIAQLEKDLGLR